METGKSSAKSGGKKSSACFFRGAPPVRKEGSTEGALR